MYQRENGSVQRASFLDNVNTAADSVGNLNCMGHIRRSLARGWGNLFTFGRGLDRTEGPCIWPGYKPSLVLLYFPRGGLGGGGLH